MKIKIGKDDNQIVCGECDNSAEVSQSMMDLLDIAMKLEVKCEKCGERLEVTKADVSGEEIVKEAVSGE